MKESLLYNTGNFNFESLRIDPKFVRVSTQNHRLVLEKCSECSKDKLSYGLIKESGWGIRSSFESFINHTRSKYYYGTCKKSYGIKAILKDFLFVDLPSIIRLEEAEQEHLAKAFILYQSELKEKRRRLVILRNIEFLPPKGLSTLSTIVKELKGKLGIVLTISEQGYEKLAKTYQQDTEVRAILSEVRWETLSPPLLGELQAFCIARGILHSQVVDMLLSKVSDFQTLSSEIDVIKEKLKSKGYL